MTDERHTMLLQLSRAQRDASRLYEAAIADESAANRAVFAVLAANAVRTVRNIQASLQAAERETNDTI